MSRVMMIVLLMLSLCACVGCGSGKDGNSQSADQMQSELDQIRADANQKRAQELESDGILSPDSAPLDDMAQSIEKAAKNSSGKQAEVLARQAEILREVQGYTKPYEQKVNELVSMGSIDPASMGGADDIDQREAILVDLTAMNERMDKELPAYFRELGRIENNSAQMERQLVLLGKIRDTDRRMYGVMIEMLGILRERWDGIEVQEDGTFLFGADIPQEQLDQYNELVGRLQNTVQEQGQLQRELLELP